MMTFIVFLAFVINTAMLINAKINLQNAADLAAYAGAAAQARQLNYISFLNYEMRRQYKKFLFRYYVMGNIAQDEFPRGPTGKKKPEWKPNPTEASYGVPAVCVVMNPADNYCHIGTIPKIAIPAASMMDKVNETLRVQLQNIEDIRQANCEQIGRLNTNLLIFWLFNADHDFSKLASMFNDPAQQQTLQTFRGLAFGLGLVPREVLLRLRIATLASYLNAPPLTLSKDKVEALKAKSDPTYYERSIQAFQSAYYTLGNHTFSDDSIELEELQNPAQIKLNDIKAEFDTYSVEFALDPTKVGQATDCVPNLIPVSVPSITLGVRKDSTVLTYYALRLKAKAKVLFSPFGEVSLKAYAAARPFGSRIGPPIDSALGNFVQASTVNNAFKPGSQGLASTKNFIPNLPIADGEVAVRGMGWDNDLTLGAMYQALAAAGSGNMITQANVEAGYQAAMAPNPYEGRRYNIPTDRFPDPFVKYFDSSDTFAFWAPLVSPEMAIGGAVDETLNTAIKETLQKPPTANASKGDPEGDYKKLLDGMMAAFKSYAATLRKGEGEDGEGFNIVHIRNPFNAGGKPITLGGGESSPLIKTDDPRTVKTSWNDVLTSGYKKQGRVGYSVKIVSFDSLTKSKQSANGGMGGGSWSNDLAPNDDEAKMEIDLIKH